jgi:repressor LexA
MELTPRQVDVLVIVRNYRHLHGYSPSIREIAASLSLSRATTVAHVKRMVQKNLLRWTPFRHRTLEVIEDNQGVQPKPTPRDRRRAAAAALDNATSAD